MANPILIKRLAWLLCLVLLPLALASVVELWLKHPHAGLVRAEVIDWWEEFWFRMFCLALTGAMALLGGWLWQRRLDQQVDILLYSCQRMALGEPAGLPDSPEQLDELGRLGLAIQVVREALVDYLSLYRRFFDTAPDMFLALNPANEQILDANQAFCRAVGRLRSEVVGRPVGGLVRLELPWGEALTRDNELHAGQLVADCATMEVEASLSLEHGPGGQAWTAGVVLRDITQHKRLLGALMQKSAALERALKEIKGVENLKDQFLTTLSHELKTPLVSLKGFLQLIMQERGKPEERDNYLQVCWRNLLKLENQINNLLELARLSHFKDQYDLGPVDLAALARTEAENMRIMAAEKKVAIGLDGVPQQPVMVRGNAEKLIQLLDNLIQNAIKYNVTNGRVDLEVSQRDQVVVLVVADSGLGIARESMAKIFNRFYQADLTGTGRLEGLGIGLSLVQEIVRLHEGDIRVESEAGQGTTFTVILEAIT
ncbi:MAG: PAS domain-containing sensor histidine kinase [Pseudomonadota bacterium]